MSRWITLQKLNVIFLSIGMTACLSVGDDSDSAEDPGPVPDLVVGLFEGVYGVPNIDDDNGNGTSDWYEGRSDIENDYIAFTLAPEIREQLRAGETITFGLSGDIDLIRIWSDEQVVLGEGDSSLFVVEALSDEEEAEEAEEIVFQVEFSFFLNRGEVTVSHWDDEGELVSEDSFEVMAAPMVLNHHLQLGEHTWALNAVGWNDPLVTGFQQTFGTDFTGLSDFAYQGDPWVQDEIEFATATASDGHRIDIVIDLIRNQGLDAFPENELEGPDFALMVWGNPDPMLVTGQDYGGNIEVAPPVTVDGVDYPLGRIYWGDSGTLYGLPAVPARELTDIFYAQEVQAPFVLDTSFLCVGHVDEFFTFVPDPSSEKGFKLVYSDVDLGYEFIESLDPAIPLQRYDYVHGLGSVGEIANDTGLRAYNEEIQQYYLDPNLDILIAELGLEEEDIILFPALFEPPPGCGDYAAALIPGTANLQLYSYPDGRTVLLPPDPFLRPEGTITALDPFILEFESLLPDTLEYVWIDDFYSYHYGLGEVHCGTNVTRTPSVDWWTEARHLITD